MNKRKAQLIVALDVDTLKQAENLVTMLYPVVKTFKVGSQLFTGCGPRVVEMIHKKGASVFLDLKYFDIPTTVANAVRQAVCLKVKMLTLHIMGDAEMLHAAVHAAKEESLKRRISRPLLIGVTVLTSKESKVNDILALARTGLECGLDGLVCSAREAKLLRSQWTKKFVMVTPGIRPNNAPVDDQRRTATVEEALDAGSDYLVVGRPILKAANPKQAAMDFMK